ncbi:FHA domain-containing protein [Streptomyces sp. NPDC101165]|uniref:FHA domain-containing protein n=1 Tax=Streptomyces sp. NPDC101165 TaxID=3366119 RepID=UPI00382C6B55
MSDVHDWDDDEDEWVTVPTPTSVRPRPRPTQPSVGDRCEQCSSVVPAGTSKCPACLSPVAVPGQRSGAVRRTPRIAGGAVRLVFRGGGRHLDVPRGSEIRLGRSSSWAPEASELLADEDTVSAQHATLVHASDGAAWLTEVPRGATNGTRVNDRVLVPGSRVRLRAGDRVELGPGVAFIVQGIAEESGEKAS